MTRHLVRKHGIPCRRRVEFLPLAEVVGLLQQAGAPCPGVVPPVATPPSTGHTLRSLLYAHVRYHPRWPHGWSQSRTSEMAAFILREGIQPPVV